MDTPTKTPSESYDQALEESAAELEVAAEEVLDEPDVKEGLEDGERDDAW